MKLKHPIEIAGLFLLLGLLIFSFFYQLSLQPVYVWDEARRANDSLQMLLKGQWIIDYYDDDPTTRGTKSPILLWLQVTSLYLFGVNEWALRFPSAAAGVSIGLLLWAFSYRFFKSTAMGVLAGSVFASTLAMVLNHAGRTGDYDIFLTLFTTLYTLCFYVHCHNLKNKWLQWFWLFLTLAVLIKGVAGLFFVPGLAVFALLQKHFKILLYNKWLYTGFLFLLMVVGSYYALREWHAPGFLQAVYNNELGGRYLKELEQNGQPLLYYFRNFTWRYPYWIYLLVPSVIAGYFSHSGKVKNFSLFTFILSITYLLIISSSKTKLQWYDLPLYPLFALQIGLLLYYGWLWLQMQLHVGVSHAVRLAMACTLSSLVFVLPFRAIHQHIKKLGSYMEDREQGWFLQQAIKQKKDLNNYTFLYEDYDRQIRYYTKRLQWQKVNVRLSNHVKDMKPGTYVVVSADSTRQKLLQLYQVAKQHEQYGCDVYFIKSKLTLEDNNFITSKKINSEETTLKTN